MALQGIDVSNYKDIDVSIARDFVIVQTTWGVGGFNNTNLVNGVSTIADKQYQRAKATGKLRAFMHYYMGNDVNAEANFFIQNNRGYVGDGIPMIDWESKDNRHFGDAGVFDALLGAFTNVLGGPGIAYFQASEYNVLKPICDKHNWGCFVAQYANMNPTGIQETPWNDSAYACALRQYSSNGQLGNGVALDLDKFYGDADAWNRYVAGSHGGQIANTPAPAPSVSINDLVQKTLRGDFGNGDARRQALGSNYDAVMAIINQQSSGQSQGSNLQDLVNRTIRGDFGNGEARRQALGSNYDAVMAVINGHPSTNNSSNLQDLVNRTIRGDFGNGEQRRQALGSNYDAVMAVINGQSTPQVNLDDLVRRTRRGDFGNGEARRQALGSNYDAVMRVINGQ